MRIHHTVLPEDRMPENEWMIRFKVSTQAEKYDAGKDKARDIMKQWQEDKKRPIFQEFFEQIIFED